MTDRIKTPEIANDDDIIRIVAIPPLELPHAEFFYSGLIRHELMTREEFRKIFPDIKV